jgi:intraflagellar transport protein 122
VTEQDWRSLGIEALKNYEFNMAKKAFVRIRDLKFIELCERSQAQYKRKEIDKITIEAEIMCYLGKFKEASLLYTKNNLPNKAIEMYTTLRKVIVVFMNL